MWVWFPAPVTSYAATFVSLPPVRGGVIDAPRLCDRRAALDAPARRDQPHPRLPRCAILASTTPRIQSRGHSPRTIDRREGTAYIASYAATFVSQSPVGCTVLGAPRLSDCRGNVGADGRRDRLHPCFLRCARLRLPSNVCNIAGTARAPFGRRGVTASVAFHAAAHVSYQP